MSVFEAGKTRLPRNNWKLEVRFIFLYLFKKYPGKGQYFYFTLVHRRSLGIAGLLLCKTD